MKKLGNHFYSYKHGFSGFAARLTDSQAKQIVEFPQVVQVLPNRIRKLYTTRSWDFMGLSDPFSENINSKRRTTGEGIIIGVIDTGIWPESPSFNDEGMKAIPLRWKGKCQEGEHFNSSNCNRKIIGARWFIKGLMHESRNLTKGKEVFSARDVIGHGSHTASTAAGNFVKRASEDGLALGLARGGAPRAHLTIYKICWNLDPQGCTNADIIKAFDKAIHDGVDVISLLLGYGIPAFDYIDKQDPISRTVTDISITRETNLVTRTNFDAESFTLFLSATERQCSYYMWRQKFPGTHEHKAERRMEVDELANFLLASSRESVLLDNKWNNGILDLVHTAFVDAFMSLVKLTATPVSYLPRMFASRPLAKPPYQELNAVRKSILGKLLGSDMISCSGFYVLLSSFDRQEYDRILDFLGVKLVDNECYANCILSSNLVSGLSEEEDYLELHHFIADNWLDFRTNDIKNLPLPKYENLNAGVSFFSMIACVQQRSSDRDSQGNCGYQILLLGPS